MGFDWGSFLGSIINQIGSKKNFDDYFGKDVTDEHTKWRQDREKERFSYDPARDYTSEVAHQFIQNRWGPESKGYTPSFASEYAKKAGMGPATMPTPFKLNNYEFPTYWRKGYMDNLLGTPPGGGRDGDGLPVDRAPLQPKPVTANGEFGRGMIPGDPNNPVGSGFPNTNFGNAVTNQNPWGQMPATQPTDWSGVWNLVKKNGPSFLASMFGIPLSGAKEIYDRLRNTQNDGELGKVFGELMGSSVGGNIRATVGAQDDMMDRVSAGTDPMTAAGGPQPGVTGGIIKDLMDSGLSSEDINALFTGIANDPGQFMDRRALMNAGYTPEQVDKIARLQANVRMFDEATNGSLALGLDQMNRGMNGQGFQDDFGLIGNAARGRF